MNRSALQGIGDAAARRVRQLTWPAFRAGIVSAYEQMVARNDGLGRQ